MSRLLLRRATRPWQWIGMTLVFSGAMVVGSTSVLEPDAAQGAGAAGSNPLLGDALVPATGGNTPVGPAPTAASGARVPRSGRRDGLALGRQRRALAAGAFSGGARHH